MKKTILEIYGLAICFITVICFMVVSGIAIYKLLAVAKPDFTLDSWQYSMHQSNDAYWSQRSMPPPMAEPLPKKLERPPENELTRQREDSYRRVLAAEQRDSFQTLVKCLIVLLIDAAAFMMHWVIARRARATAA